MNIFSSILLINNSGGEAAPEPPAEDWLEGWMRRKRFDVDGTITAESIIELRVYNTAGTDTTTEVYLDGNVRSDWGDVRFTTSDKLTCIPYAILEKNATNILVAVNLGNIQDGLFYIYYDGPAASLFKIMHVSDIHYDPAEPSVDNRDESLVFLDNMIARAVVYQPDLIAKGGDDVGSVTESESPRLALFQDVVDKVAEFGAITPVPEIMHVAPGNHDFDFTTFSNTRAILTQAWMETNTLYGSKEVGPYLIVSLDAQYVSGGQTHQSDTHDGFGYVNTDQLTWLTAELAAATKPVILFCHQPLSEMDTDQFTLTKETYHTQNRAAIRDIIEASNKVVCCIHGHVHYSRNDVINGIPYITITNIGNTGQFGEQPATNTGKWAIIELDESSKTIRVATEAVVSGTVQTIYEQVLGFGPTSFTDDVSHAPERVFALGYAASNEKSSIMRNPVISYVADDANLYKYPRNRNIPDPDLSENTIKIVGRNNTPNFGRDVFQFAPQTGTFRARWNGRVSTVKSKFVKFGDSSVATTPGAYIQFNNDGNIKAFNAAVNTTLLAYSIDTWYKFEAIINVAADTFILYVDDGLEANGFAFVNSVAAIDRIEIVTETGNLYLNNFRIMPYTDIAITAFQAEETI